MIRARKGYVPSVLNEASRFPFTDQEWTSLARLLPGRLDAESDARLRQEINSWCDGLAEVRQGYEKAAAIARLLRPPGKGQRSLLDQLAKNLRDAAVIASHISNLESDLSGVVTEPVHAEWSGLFRDLNKLQGMATAVERVRDELNTRQPSTLENPWPKFVQGVAQALRDVGLKPTASGSTYHKLKESSWFQKFVKALNDTLPESVCEPSASDDAMYSRIAKAQVKGGRKPGKSQP